MTVSPEKTLWFTRLALQNWKNFQNAEVSLSGRAFFVGPNASGKSNLLDAFRFLRDLATAGGGLAASVEDRGGMSSLRCLHARRNNSVELTVDVGDETDPRVWSYRIKFNQKTDHPVVEEEEVRKAGAVILKRTTRSEAADPEQLAQTHLEQITQNKNFRDLAELFRSVRYLHVVPQIVRDARRAVDNRDDPFGGDLLARIDETPKATRTQILERISSALAIAVPQFDSLRLVHDKGIPHLQAGFKNWRSGSTRQTEAQFSDGTLRLIGFLWSISEAGGPLLLEEPELSLNDAISQALPSMIATMQVYSGRQVLMTTHSTALLRDEGVGLDEAHLLSPTDNGTEIITAKNDENVCSQVQAGMPIGEALLPRAAAPNVHNLLGFDVSAR